MEQQLPQNPLLKYLIFYELSRINKPREQGDWKEGWSGVVLLTDIHLVKSEKQNRHKKAGYFGGNAE